MKRLAYQSGLCDWQPFLGGLLGVEGRQEGVGQPACQLGQGEDKELGPVPNVIKRFTPVIYECL
jgi:hypothetical protein